MSSKIIQGIENQRKFSYPSTEYVNRQRTQWCEEERPRKETGIRQNRLWHVGDWTRGDWVCQLHPSFKAVNIIPF